MHILPYWIGELSGHVRKQFPLDNRKSPEHIRHSKLLLHDAQPVGHEVQIPLIPTPSVHYDTQLFPWRYKELEQEVQ